MCFVLCPCSWLADVDNNEAYERDEYSLAGIPEAAPKVKRREEEEEDNRCVGDLSFRAIYCLVTAHTAAVQAELQRVSLHTKSTTLGAAAVDTTGAAAFDDVEN